MPSTMQASGRSKPLHEQSIDDFDELAVNVRGLFLCMKYEIQQMLTQRTGVIVNTSAIAGLCVSNISVCRGKHAVVGLTRRQRWTMPSRAFGLMQLAPALLRLGCLLMAVGITADDFASMVPMGRIGQAEEIAQTVVFSLL